jgi:hypothetical protein
METTNTNYEPADGPRGLIDQVRDRASAQLTTQKNRATEGLGSLAQLARDSTQSLRDNQHDAAAAYVSRAAEKIEGVSARLRELEVGDLFREAEQFARRRPAVFMGAAFAIGIVAVRFLRSSAPRGQYASTGRSAF